MCALNNPEKYLPEDFNWREYVAKNPDISEAGVQTKKHAINHYLYFGNRENRIYKIDSIPADFDHRIYSLLNTDLYEAYRLNKNLLESHYINYGCREGRVYKCDYTYEQLIKLSKNQNINNYDIVLINHESSKTGAPVFLQDFANWLCDNNFNNIAFVDCIPNNLYDLKPEIHKLFHFNKKENLLNILNNSNPVLIYSNSLSIMVKFYESFKHWSNKTIYHFHECRKEILDTIKQEKILQQIQEQSLYTFFVANAIRNDCGLSADNTHIIPEFINTERINSILIHKNRTNITNKKPLIGMCGSNCERKNPQLFIDLAKYNPHYNFMWIGAELNETVKNLTCVPMTDNPYQYFQQLDYFLLTSQRDPCPIVVLENLLLNKKVILLKNNIKYEHPVDKLENVFVIENHNNDPKIISKFFQTIDINTVDNKTTKNRDYILEHFSKPLIQIKPIKKHNSHLFISYYCDNDNTQIEYYINLINYYILFNPYIQNIHIALSSNSSKYHDIQEQLKKHINFDKLNIIIRENNGWDIGGFIDILSETASNINQKDSIIYIHNKSNEIWRNSLYKILYFNSHQINNFDTIVSKEYLLPCSIDDLNRQRFKEHECFENKLATQEFDYISGTCFITKFKNLTPIVDRIDCFKNNITTTDTHDTFWIEKMLDKQLFDNYYKAHKNHLLYSKIDYSSRQRMMDTKSKNYFDLHINHQQKGIPDYTFEHALERYIGYLITHKKNIRLV